MGTGMNRKEDAGNEIEKESCLSLKHRQRIKLKFFRLPRSDRSPAMCVQATRERRRRRRRRKFVSRVGRGKIARAQWQCLSRLGSCDYHQRPTPFFLALSSSARLVSSSLVGDPTRYIRLPVHGITPRKGTKFTRSEVERQPFFPPSRP